MARRFALLASLLLFVPAVAWADLDTGKPLLCAVTQAIQCGYEAACEAGPVDELNLPPFLVIDRKAMELREYKGDRKTPLRSAEEKDGQLVLLGFERRPFGITISQQSGRLSAAALDPDAGFVVFGICTNQ